MDFLIPSPLRDAFEHLKAAARVRRVETDGSFEVRCSGRASDPCTEASVRFLEAVVRELPHVRLILDEKEDRALEALACTRLSTDTRKVRFSLDVPRTFTSYTWELPAAVDVRRLRADVLSRGHYVITAGDPAATGGTLPRQDWNRGLLETTRITLALSSHADDDTWTLWFRPEAPAGSSPEAEEAAGA